MAPTPARTGRPVWRGAAAPAAGAADEAAEAAAEPAALVAELMREPRELRAPLAEELFTVRHDQMLVERTKLTQRRRR